MKRITILLILGLNFLTWGWAAEKPATVGKSEWPSWRGDGSGSSRSGAEMITSLSEAKLAWQSEEIGPSPLYRHPGTGYCDPIVAGGRVFVFWFRRSGADLVDMHFVTWGRWYSLIDPPDNPEAYAVGIGQRIDLPPKEASAWQRHVRADDIITCFDERTGKKLWERAFPGQGINLVSNAGGLCVPCVHDGRLYALGSSGQVYALDAATGKAIWQSDLGYRAEQFDQAAEIFSRTRLRVTVFGCVLNTAVVYADGVVAVGEGVTADCGGEGMKDDPGVGGFDATTGKRLWNVPKCLAGIAGAPAVWRHEGKEYFLAAGDRMVLIEPKTGKELWSIGDPKNPITGGVAPAVSGDYVVVNKSVVKTSGTPGPNMLGPACYQISLTGAKLLWNLPISECHSISLIAPAVDGQYAYVPILPGAVCVELATGKKVGEPLPGFSHAYACYTLGDGLIGQAYPLQLGQTSPVLKRMPGALPGKPDFGEYHTPAFANGRVYWRGNKTLWCYDLRKNPTPLPEPSTTPTFTGKEWDEMEPVATLVKLLESTDDLSVRRAIHQLGMLGPRAAEATTDLVKMVETGDHDHAALAARALGRIGPGAASAVPALLKCTAATNANLKYQATRALCHIGTKDPAALAVIVDAAIAQPWFHTQSDVGPGPARVKAYRTMALSLLDKAVVPILLERSRVILKKGLGARWQRPPAPYNYQHITEMANAAYMIDPESAKEFLPILGKIPRLNPPALNHHMLHWTMQDLTGNMDLREGKGGRVTVEKNCPTNEGVIPGDVPVSIEMCD